MDFLSFNNWTNPKNSPNAVDPLSVFRPKNKENLTIEEGMSADEISDIVSKKVIAVIEKEFEKAMKQQT